MIRALLVCAALLAALPARAEVSEIRMSKQYGLGYLSMMVMESQHLIEKHAAAAGLGTVTVTWRQLTGPSMMIDTMMSGTMDFITPGSTTLITMWDKTAGTPQEMLGLGAIQSMPFVLVTRNPDIKTIRDFTAADRIALPGVKLTGHALTLEMAAAKEWGFENYDRLDPLTVTWAHPDAATALLSGKSEIDAHYASSPFYYYELARPGMHQVLKSYDVVGGPHTNGVLMTSKRFHDANPKATAAVVAAVNEANAYIKENPRGAAEIYLALSGEKLSTIDDMIKMVTDPDVTYTTTPVRVMAFAEFMFKVGRLKHQPKAWTDFFFPEAQSLPGS